MSVRSFFRNERIHTYIVVVVAVLCNLLPYHIPEIIEGDSSISKSYNDPLSSVSALGLTRRPFWIVLYVLLCAFSILAVSYLFVQPEERSKVITREVLVCLRSYCNVLIVSIILKKLVSFPRPCFFDMCKSAFRLSSMNRYDPLTQDGHRYGVRGREGSLSKCVSDVYLASIPHV